MRGIHKARAPARGGSPEETNLDPNAAGSGVGWSRQEEPTDWEEKAFTTSQYPVVQWLLLAVAVTVVMALLVALGVSIWLVHARFGLTG